MGKFLQPSARPGEPLVHQTGLVIGADDEHDIAGEWQRREIDERVAHAAPDFCIHALALQPLRVSAGFHSSPDLSVILLLAAQYARNDPDPGLATFNLRNDFGRAPCQYRARCRDGIA